MSKFLRICIIASTTVAAGPTFANLDNAKRWIDGDRIAWDLDPTNPAFDAEVEDFEMRGRLDSDGLRVSEYDRPDELETARVFASLLRLGRPDQALWLLGCLRGYPLPAFNGTSMGPGGVVEANLKMSRLRPPVDEIGSVIEVFIDKIQRYGQRPAWGEFVFKNMLTLTDRRWNNPRRRILVTPYAFRKYQRLIVIVRRMMRLVGVDTARKSRLLLRLRDPSPLPHRLIDQLARHTYGDSVISHVLILQDDCRLTISEGANIQRLSLPPCEDWLNGHYPKTLPIQEP